MNINNKLNMYYNGFSKTGKYNLISVSAFIPGYVYKVNSLLYLDGLKNLVLEFPKIKKNLVLRNRVLALKINALGLDLQKIKTTGALVMSPDTNWKWQWCVLRMASNQFIAALSPEFNSTEDSQEWMNAEIAKIAR